MKIRLAALAFAAFATLLTACSSDDDPTVQTDASDSTATTTTGAPTEEAAHNDADVAFAQGMIPHHEQAIEMAKLAFSRGEDDRVKELAAKIEGAQEPEIAIMTGWLNQWEEPLQMEGHGDDMAGESMNGMMSEDDMAELEAASGVSFDRAFLEMMIEHHRGAIQMAEAEIADGEYPEAVELARTIVSAQSDEIDEMEGILQDIG